jgi:hypothetical protein
LTVASKGRLGIGHIRSAAQQLTLFARITPPLTTAQLSVRADGCMARTRNSADLTLELRSWMAIGG